MTKVELKKAAAPLSKYAERARKEPVIVVRRGKPFAAVVALRVLNPVAYFNEVKDNG